MTSTDYCSFCCCTHVTGVCPREDETEKQYWDRMRRLENEEQGAKNET